jgi:hypothetical protein
MNFAGKSTVREGRPAAFPFRRFAVPIICLTTLAFISSLRAEEAPPANANPYTGIVVRNMFALVPIPTNPPVDTTPPDPPIKLTPNGIMNVFGQLEVIFKAAIPAKGKDAAHDQSYVMAEGEREDDIEVVKIDDKDSIITFINHGIKQDLPLADAPTITSPAASPPSGPAGGVPMPASTPSPSVVTDRPMRNGPAPGSPGAARLRALAAAGQNISGSSSSQNNNQVTPEEQIVNMEKQRAQWLDEGNAAATIIPPTKLGEALVAPEPEK